MFSKMKFFCLFIILKHIFCEHESHIEEDHRAFLGRRQYEFDELSVKESRRRLKMLLPHIDGDKDGLISFDELEDWVRKKYESLLDTEDPLAIFRQTDTNFDDFASWHEYLWRHFGIRENGSDAITDELKNQFSAYILRDLKRWKHADRNHDGVLNQDEFSMFVKPRYFAEMMDLVAEEELEETDENGDGYVSLDEYLASLHMPEMRSWDEMKFNENYDANKDGRLDLSEVKIWKTPELFDKSKLEAKHLIQIADDNKDESLSFEEILLHHFVFVGSKATRSGSMLHDEF